MGQVATSPSVTLHSSWRHLISTASGASVLVLLGGTALAAAGPGAVPVIVLLVGAGAMGVVLFDVPVAATFDVDGVERRMVLRRHRIRWCDNDQLTRTRPTLLRAERSLQHGGLVLRRGRRRYLLVDRSESAAEFDALVALLDGPGGPPGGLGVAMLPRPGERIPPTWLYRRAHWRPDAGAER